MSTATTAAFTPQCIVHWFRRDLRLHDNPALNASLRYCQKHHLPLLPVFAFDAHLHAAPVCAPVRLNFLLQSLQKLDSKLQTEYGLPRLHYVYSPSSVAPVSVAAGAKAVFFQREYDEHSKTVEVALHKALDTADIELHAHDAFLLYKNPDRLLRHSPTNRAPLNMNGFLNLVSGLPVDAPLPFAEDAARDVARHEPLVLPEIKKEIDTGTGLPSIQEVRGRDGFRPVTAQDKADMELFEEHLRNTVAAPAIEGGEDAALTQLSEYKARDGGATIRNFSKPETSPADFAPRATTGLSAHLVHGTLSARTMYHAIPAASKKKGKVQQVQTTLRGQLLWREHFWLLCHTTAHFEQMEGNALCRQIAWDARDEEVIAAWTEGRTGYPWIDGLMNQLRREGFVHHLGRHCVACFLTRGDLWQSWEVGRDVFRKYLIDHDHALNAANWMWLSCSAFFHAYHRVYGPVSFAKKWTNASQFVRAYAPLSKGVLDPWSSGLVKVNYHKRIVVHEVTSKANIQRMKSEFARLAASKSDTDKKSTTTGGRARKAVDDADSEGCEKEKKAPKRRRT